MNKQMAVEFTYCITLCKFQCIISNFQNFRKALMCMICDFYNNFLALLMHDLLYVNSLGSIRILYHNLHIPLKILNGLSVLAAM